MHACSMKSHWHVKEIGHTIAVHTVWYYKRDLHAVVYEQEEQQKLQEEDKLRRQRGAKLLQVCPGDWLQPKIIHLCDGCCSSSEESAILVYDTSVPVVMKSIPTPAKNKWLQVYPTMADLALACSFHDAMPQALVELL